MTIQKVFSDQNGEERLYSVLMNEEELRLFAKHKHNAQNAAANGTRAAEAQANKAAKLADKYSRHAGRIAQEFGGDIDKFVEANPRYKSMYGAQAAGSHREALQNVLNGQKATEQASVQKHAHSAAVQTHGAADQVNKLAKTREAYRTETGGHFKKAGLDVTAHEGIKGDVAVNAKAGAAEGNKAINTLSSTSESRARTMQKVENNGVVLNSGPKGGHRSKRKVKLTTSAPTQELNRPGVNEATTVIRSNTPRQKTSVAINAASSAPATVERAVMPKAKERTSKRATEFISKNWNKLGKKGKIAAGVATAAGVTGLGYGAYKLATKDKSEKTSNFSEIQKEFAGQGKAIKEATKLLKNSKRNIVNANLEGKVMGVIRRNTDRSAQAIKAINNKYNSQVNSVMSRVAETGGRHEELARRAIESRAQKVANLNNKLNQVYGARPKGL